jgi:hypothetical protein
VSPLGPDSGTPTQAEHSQLQGDTPIAEQAQVRGHAPQPSNGTNGYREPIVSTFSTSSADLHPYPQHLLGTQAGQAPPQVVHYHGQRGGSQANTPTLSTSQEGSHDRASSQDPKSRRRDDSLNTTPIAVTLPDGKMEATALRDPDSPESDTTDTTDDSVEEEKASSKVRPA